MPQRHYTIEEEIGNTTTHTLGALICAFLFGIFAHMTYAGSDSILKNIACYIFGLSSMFVFIASSLYHAVTNQSIKTILKKYDHIAIYYLIAGTYIPLATNLIIPTNPIIGWLFIALQISAVVFGTFYKLFATNKYGYASVIIYCLIGWSILPLLGIIGKNISTEALQLLIGGGAFYMLGVPFYILKQYRWTHTIWHIFVVLGIICHYLMMFRI